MNSDNLKPDARWGEPAPLHDPYILANFKARNSDVLITTPPKAGTTWMQQILYQLRTGGDDGFMAIDEVVPWLEITRQGKSWQQILLQFEKLPTPRIFKTHCTAEQTPGIGTANIILSSRDPRDCCVSFYHHILNMTDEARQHKEIPAPASFDEHVDNWLEFAAWYRNVKSWWPYIDHPRVLWLRYQDLKTDFEGNLDKIISFLQWPVNDSQKQTVMEFSSFDWMKAHDEKFSSQGVSAGGHNSKPVFKPGKFVRQGKVGDYRELMTVEQEHKILLKAKKLLEPECIRFLELDL